jgi:hypothetical protein
VAIAEAITNGVDAMHGWIEAMRAARHPIAHRAAPRRQSRWPALPRQS